MKLLRRWLPVILLLLVHGPVAAEMRVDSAWVREPPPVATPVAVYLDLVNDGPQLRTLVGVSSPHATSVQVHTTELVAGVARMRHLEQVAIPAAGRVGMQPGGMHLMVFGLQQVPRAGDELSLLLEFADGGCLQVRVPVLPSRSLEATGN